MTTVAIVVALVVVIAAVAVFLLRGKSPGAGTQLQGPGPGLTRSQPPSAPSRPPPGRLAKEPGRREPSRPPPPPARSSAPPVTSADVVSVAPEQAAAPPAPTPSRAPRDVAGLRKGLAATRGGFVAKLNALFRGKKEIDPTILQQIEEIMLTSDVGPKTTAAILERLRDSLAHDRLRDADAVWAELRAEARRILSIGGGSLR
ncbi:MAG: signal recognition particle receptor subunit alpha, partial [Myxococcales bacterium]|nr:signal recognition particle receptor subunit alpha [Myxococcales bacterium]